MPIFYMFTVYVRRHDKGVATFGKAHSKLTANLVRRFGGLSSRDI